MGCEEKTIINSHSISFCKYFEFLPIIYCLGLIPTAVALYGLYKTVCGDLLTRSCSNKKLTEILGISVKTLIKSRRELEEAKKVLGDKRLINVSSNFDKNGGKTTSTVNIVDIWDENFMYFLNKDKDYA